ncbi:ERF family protein [Bosea sp. NPDC055594]
MSEAALILRPEEAAPVRQQAMTPVDMLSMAVERGANIEVMTKLMDLRDRWEAGQARKAFDEAVASAKAQIPTIAKNREGHNNKRYADFAAIASVVDPIIGQYGLSYRFRTTQTDRINVTCILSHKAGHAEETTLSGPADTSGSKNAIQAIGSTLTYLQRYTLVQALGLAASEDDDGGKSGGQDAETITEDQVMQLRELIEATKADQRGVLAYVRARDLSSIRADKFPELVSMLKRKEQRRG